MALPYKTVLILGATSGIGAALADKFVATGAHVIVTGRRQERLNGFVEKHGAEKVTAVAFDSMNLKAIPEFATGILATHPTLDCLILNSGIMRKTDFTSPETLDLDVVDAEIATNYTSYVHLLKAFLPHFLSPAVTSPTQPSAIMLTTSALAYVPIVRTGNYCATKAALHQLSIVLRHQLPAARPGLRVVEIAPPAVQTELSDKRNQPDLEHGASWGLPLDEYIEATWRSLLDGRDEIVMELSAAAYEIIEKPRIRLFHEVHKAVTEGLN